ncbi:MAG: hypothetical protein LBE09_01425, partial [Christensenellaceae bacterium]|nr:hypothetical protein [Christensenellaceae bacterium]
MMLSKDSNPRKAKRFIYCAVVTIIFLLFALLLWTTTILRVFEPAAATAYTGTDTNANKVYEAYDSAPQYYGCGSSIDYTVAFAPNHMNGYADVNSIHDGIISTESYNTNFYHSNGSNNVSSYGPLSDVATIAEHRYFVLDLGAARLVSGIDYWVRGDKDRSGNGGIVDYEIYIDNGNIGDIDYQENGNKHILAEVLTPNIYFKKISEGTFKHDYSRSDQLSGNGLGPGDEGQLHTALLDDFYFARYVVLCGKTTWRYDLNPPGSVWGDLSASEIKI